MLTSEELQQTKQVVDKITEIENLDQLKEAIAILEAEPADDAISFRIEVLKQFLPKEEAPEVTN